VLGEKIKKLRNDRGLLQNDVAKAIGVSAAMISKYETGQKYPSQETLIKISRFFNVSMSYLITNSEINMDANTVYEQVKKYLKEYEYEMFKKQKNQEESEGLDKFISILKSLDDRATFEAYTNIDKETEYIECIIKMVKSLYHLKNFFETIIATINHEEIDTDKLEDESTFAINMIEDTLNKLTEVDMSSDEAVDELSHIQINYNKNIIDLSKVKKITPLPRKEEVPEHLKLNAAHRLPNATKENIQHDEDIMDDPNF
jgi:transcriptional regulator with XRE-family HTH domain